MKYTIFFFCLGSITLYCFVKKKESIHNKKIDGIVFGETGVHFSYQLGITYYMQKHFQLKHYKTAGISGGCQSAFLIANHRSVKNYFNHFVLEIFREDKKIPFSNIFQVCEDKLTELYGKKCKLDKLRKSFYICVTQLFPCIKNCNAHDFHSYHELMESMKASQFIPFLFGSPWIRYKKNLYIDGYFSSFRYKPTNENWFYLKMYHFNWYYYITGFFFFHKMFDKQYHETLFDKGYKDAKKKHDYFLKNGFIEK